MQFVERHAWIGVLNVYYHLGLDGMSLLLVLLTGLVGPVALLASWKIERDVRHLQPALPLPPGRCARRLHRPRFLPLVHLLGAEPRPRFLPHQTLGGPNASSAAYQFVVYTIGGSAFMLLAFAALFAATGTFDFTELAVLAQSGALATKVSATALWPQAIFLGVLLGLAVKVPLFPFHTWLPRRLRRGAHRRLDVPHRHHVEDGRLRFPSASSGRSSRATARRRARLC